MSTFDNATLMITGGTGSFGSTVLKHFLDSDLKEIRIFSRTQKRLRKSSSISVMSAIRSPSRTLCRVLTTFSMPLH